MKVQATLALAASSLVLSSSSIAAAPVTGTKNATSGMTWLADSTTVPCGDNVMVPLKIFYESLCSFCQKAVGEVVFGAYQKYPALKDVLNLELAPSGNTMQAADGSITCQHGVKECDGNVLELCGMQLNGWQWQEYLPYVACFEKKLGAQVSEENPDPNTNMLKIAESCVTNTSGFTTAQLQTCFKNDYSKMAKWVAGFTATTKAVAPWQYVPAYVFGNFNACGKKDDAGEWAHFDHMSTVNWTPDSFKDEVCKKYKAMGGNTSSLCA